MRFASMDQFSLLIRINQGKTHLKVRFLQINFPAASGGVLIRQPSLLHPMPPLIHLTLLLHIRPNHRFISMLTHRTRKIPIRPKLTTPQGLLDLRLQPENLSRCQTFDDRHQLHHAITRYALHQEMHMVTIRPDLEKPDLVAFLDLHAGISQRFINRFVNHRSSVLGRENKVVQQHVDIMAFVNQSRLAHGKSLTPQAVGNQTRSD
jgi:hypothetical protein